MIVVLGGRHTLSHTALKNVIMSKRLVLLFQRLLCTALETGNRMNTWILQSIVRLFSLH